MELNNISTASIRQYSRMDSIIEKSLKGYDMEELTYGLVRDVKRFVKDMFRNNRRASMTYHNLGHTRKVVSRSKKIARHYALSKHEYITLLVSAWLHDTGYFMDPVHHEVKSSEIAESYLRVMGADDQFIKQVKLNILATKRSDSPSNIMEKILCDADAFYLGTKAFYRLYKERKRELQLIRGEKIPRQVWLEESLKFIVNHAFYTDYASDKLNSGKARNVDMLRSKVASLDRALA